MVMRMGIVRWRRSVWTVASGVAIRWRTVRSHPGLTGIRVNSIVVVVVVVSNTIVIVEVLVGVVVVLCTLLGVIIVRVGTGTGTGGGGGGGGARYGSRRRFLFFLRFFPLFIRGIVASSSSDNAVFVSCILGLVRLGRRQEDGISSVG